MIVGDLLGTISPLVNQPIESRSRAQVIYFLRPNRVMTRPEFQAKSEPP